MLDRGLVICHSLTLKFKHEAIVLIPFGLGSGCGALRQDLRQDFFDILHKILKLTIDKVVFGIICFVILFSCSFEKTAIRLFIFWLKFKTCQFHILCSTVIFQNIMTP